MSDKNFFRERTKGEIKKLSYLQIDNLYDISNLDSNEYTIFDLYRPDHFESARKFMKHGDEVLLKRFKSLEHAIELRLTPVKLREQKFDRLVSQNYCSFSYQPVSGKDQRKRKIPLVECLEGARLFAYSHQVAGTRIKVKAYADAKRVEKEGAEVVIEVPSRRKDKPRIQLKLSSVPYIDSPDKFGITHSMSSDHTCPYKRFNIRYKYLDDKESSKVFNFCAHEIAGYFELLDQEWNNNKNLVPLEMCPFAIPTKKTVEFYLRLENNLLIRDNNIKSKDKLRKPNKADKEIALWSLVRSLGHDKTFFSRQKRDGLVEDYDWKI